MFNLGEIAKDETSIANNDSEGKRNSSSFRLMRVVSNGAILFSFKSIKTKFLLESIQLGVKHIVGGLATRPKLDLLISDFATNEEIEFLNHNSNFPKPSYLPEFDFKTYAPIIFHYFKTLYKINLDDYQNSICSPIHSVPNSGASESLFFVTSDDKYIMKTVQHKESRFLQRLLSGYFLNIKQNPNTLLPKFFGHYRYKCISVKYSINPFSPKKVKNIRLVVMNNLIPSGVEMYQKFDLKGSTYNREASPPELAKTKPTLKDLDFMKYYPNGLYLNKNDYKSLIDTLKSDVSVLENYKIMDYSLLMAVRKINDTKKKGKSKPDEDQSSNAKVNNALTIRGIPAKSINGEELLLYVGIIDILQTYDPAKYVEHAIKSRVQDKNGISVKPPREYAERFLEFMTK